MAIVVTTAVKISVRDELSTSPSFTCSLSSCDTLITAFRAISVR